MKLHTTITLMAVLACLFVNAQDKQSREYPVVVKFISIGSGVPDKKPVTDFVNSFQKKYKTRKIQCERIGPLGREGEYNLAFSLTELTAKQKKLFIQQIKKVTKRPGDRGEIQFEEHVVIEKPKTSDRPKSQTIKIE